ncbi:hypothetical protein PVL29_000611 [Vitis rotundifolia]|uniref:Retrovirus-related Pol polyprotein from transposon TNT 1-94-like beta-barrel domain-containing protein n=1 Tax=Vitis rotundifolia TaxID=103349 RepID=A0AA39AKF2_VITRO|nr:hypothetical protein PVL29_000611 [Vitis rotundifolia]
MLDLSFRPKSSALLTYGPHRPHAATGRGPHAAAGRGPHAAKSSRPSPRQSKRTYCEHCKKLGHTKDTFWALHGKPAYWKPKQPKAHSHQASTETQADKTPIEICQSTSSIIDSGVSDHMTDAHHLFSTYSPCAGNLKVKIANGTLSPVAGKGSIRISKSITLNPVLHVPNLSSNLLFISKLTKSSNCSAKFLPSHCVFQDLSSGKTIGSAKERESLYYFDKTDVLGQCSPTVCNSASYPKDSELFFQYFKHLFPSLSSNKTLLDFQCEVCELAKHHRASFPKSKYKSSIPFTLIHNDLWGLSRTLIGPIKNGLLLLLMIILAYVRYIC